MSEVVDIRSRKPVYHEGSPNPRVVAAIEDLLALARDGKVTGVAWTGIGSDFSVETEGHTGDVCRAMAGSLLAVANRVASTR